jgi:hypothetical protein
MNQIAEFAESTLVRLADQVGTIEPRILAAISIILVVFAATSRRLLIFLGATLLALVGFLVLLVPSSAATLIAISAGLGSLLITIAGMRCRQRRAVERHNFDKLSHAVRQLELAEGRRFVQSLNSQSRQGPIAMGDVAAVNREIADWLTFTYSLAKRT